MLAADGAVAEVSAGGEPVGWLGCYATSTTAVPGSWWRRARASKVWLDYFIEWTVPDRLQNGYGDEHGSAESDDEIDGLLADWEASVHWRGGERLALRWVPANEARWARHSFGWPAPFTLAERFGWGEADDDSEKLLAACPSAAITSMPLPDSAQGGVGFKAVRVDDDSLALSRESRPPETPFGLWFPESLDRVQEIDATRLVLTSVERFDPEPLHNLPSSVQSLALYGVPVQPKSLRLDRLRVDELIVGWGSVYRSAAISPTIRRLAVVDQGPSSLLDIPASDALEELDVGAGQQLTSLEGLERFPRLRSLAIANSPRLHDISAIQAQPHLRSLTFDGCTRVRDFSPAAACSELTDFWLVDCADVQSIAFVRDLRSLSSLGATGTTNIVDGDLEPILELRHLRSVAIARRRHYQPRVPDLYERLGISTDTLHRSEES